MQSFSSASGSEETFKKKCFLLFAIFNNFRAVSCYDFMTCVLSYYWPYYVYFVLIVSVSPVLPILYGLDPEIKLLIDLLVLNN